MQVRKIWMAIIPLWGSACETGTPSNSNQNVDDKQSLVMRLPEPRVRLSAMKTWTKSAEKARAAEVADYILRHTYRDKQIIDTVQTAQGTIIDYFDIAEFKKASHLEPPPLSFAPTTATLGTPEIAMSPSLKGPPGSIPFVRPDFGRYISGESGQKSLINFIKNRKPYRIDGWDRLYGGYKHLQENKGVGGIVSMFAADPVEQGTFTLLETAVACPQENSTEMVGIAFSRDLANFSDQELRLHIEYRSSVWGHGWDDDIMFVPYSQRTIAPGMAFTQATAVGGGIHWENFFQIQQDGDGNWWVYAYNSWLGYYPSYLFSAGLAQRGCMSSWYGEVYDPTPQSWTTNSMGNGPFASAGWNGYAAYWRYLAHLPLNTTNWTWANYAAMSLSVQKSDTCYTTSEVNPSGGPWGDPIFFLGGPGGKNQNCE